MSIRVVIIDDHEMFRDGLKAVLAMAGRDIEVVGEAGTARAGGALVNRVTPDVALVDLGLPDSDGVSLARELAREQGCRVLVVTMYAGPELAREVMVAGVQGYVVKTQPAAELVRAIEIVAEGGRYIAPGLADLVTSPSANGTTVLRSLTNRERDVFRLAVRGASNDAIARELSISRKTVETHRARVNTKLDVHSAADLVRFAARHGLLPRA